MTQVNSHDRAWKTLRLVYGLVPLLAGLDKFFNILTNWEQYLSPLAAQFLPVPASVFMGFVGIVEMVAGIAVLTRWAKPAAYVVAVWLAAIALNLVSSGAYLDIAVRDLVMAAGAYSLAELTAARETGSLRSRHPASRTAEVQSGAA